MLFIVISYENFCIFTSTQSAFVANAVMGSSIDAFVRSVPRHFAHYNDYSNPIYFQENILSATPNNKLSIDLIDQSGVSDQWLANRKIIFRRQRLFEILEIYIIGALVRVQRYKWDGFSALASTELSACDPSTNTYTLMIEEYARIVGMPEELLYKDLKLKLEADNITKFRITALAEKWKNKINQTTSFEEMDLIGPEMYQEFVSNSFI